MAKLLGIDYGDKRIGLALAETGGPALPYRVITNDKELWLNLANILKEEKIDILVIGLPRSLSGQKNERQTITENFISQIKQRFGLPTAVVDERLTSKLYEKLGVTKDLDKHAARAILDTYLTQNDL